MAADLLQSLAELEKMLKDMSNEGLIDPHLSSDSDDENSPYCIKNGAYVRVDEDGMKAWLYLNPPKEGEKFYSRSDIVEFINQNKVIKGLHESNISAIAKKHVYEREICIANGLAPLEGKDGYFECFFDTVDKRKPLIREDGSVDYTSTSRLTNVKVGDKVAMYHHAVTSVNGYDVYGNEIQAKPSKELAPLRGRGITNEGHTDEYYATITGKIEYVDGRIDIKDVHEVYGDVTILNGRVEFFGDIHITGNVEAGSVIRASRNVTVDGVVEAATIYAGGNVVIARGIQGGMKGSITAKGSVLAEFIEHATVVAGGDVRSNSFINSEVDSSGMILAEGKNGIILGGHVRGLQGVSAVCIGNEVETKTFVESGYTEKDYTSYVDTFQRETEAQEKLSEVVDEITTLLKDKRLGKWVDNEITERKLKTLTEDKDKYFDMLDNARLDKERLEKIIEKGKGSSILVNDKIFRGTTIGIEGTIMNVPANTCFMKYHNEGGRISSSVSVYH